MNTRVYLFSYDPHVERVCAAAMRSCYSPHAGYSLYVYSSLSRGELEGEKAFDDERVNALLKKALELGHHDILEHGLFTFDLQSISRACSHQLVRHRIASYSQQSQRYVKITRSRGYIKPPSISKDMKIPVNLAGRNVELSFEDIVDATQQMEEAYIKLGIRPEDSRYIRPNSAATNIVASMNPRQLLHFFSLRCAPDAQWEIRDISWAMYLCVRVIAPTIFASLPNAESNQLMRKKIELASRVADRARDTYLKAQPGDLVKVPVEELQLEHQVEVYIRRITSNHV